MELFTATRQTFEIPVVEFVYWQYSNLYISQFVFLPTAT